MRITIELDTDTAALQVEAADIPASMTADTLADAVWLAVSNAAEGWMPEVTPTLGAPAPELVEALAVQLDTESGRASVATADLLWPAVGQEVA